MRFSVYFSSSEWEVYCPCGRPGEVSDVSMGGARICSVHAEFLSYGTLLEILYLPEPG